MATDSDDIDLFGGAGIDLYGGAGGTDSMLLFSDIRIILTHSGGTQFQGSGGSRVHKRNPIYLESGATGLVQYCQKKTLEYLRHSQSQKMKTEKRAGAKSPCRKNGDRGRC